MSEKKARSVEEIKQEYSSLCAQAGHLQYQVFTLGKDLGLLNDQLRELNFEAAKARAEEESSKSGAV